MKVQVNSDMCEGHGKCELAALRVFKLGANDISVVLIPGEIPADLVDSVERAIRLCPRQAITKK